MIGDEYAVSALTKIRNYFGYDDHVLFWNRVVYFNYLCYSVGGRDQKYYTAPPEESPRFNERCRRLFAEHKPDKIFLFSKKAWNGLGPEVNQVFDKAEDIVVPQGVSAYAIKRTEVGGHKAVFAAAKHPERARTDAMKALVNFVMETNG